MRLARYLDEMQFSFRAGERLSDKLKLCVSTLRYHTGNWLGAHDGMDRPPERYSLDLTIGGGPAVGAVASRPALRDVWLRTSCGDLFVFYEIFMDEAYAVDVPAREAVDTVVDLGANIGLTTLYFSQLFPNARFVCVEPDPSNLVVLKRNLAALGDRAVVVEGAVGARDGTGQLASTGMSYASRVTDDPGGDSAGTPVPVVSMEQLMARHGLDRVDVLKVDIEGAEKALFAGGPDWLDRVDLVLAELHPPYTQAHFRRDVARHGFDVYPSATDRAVTIAARNA